MCPFQAINLLLVTNLLEKVEKFSRLQLLFILMINCQTDIHILTIEVTTRKNKTFVAETYKLTNLSKSAF